MYHFTDDAFKEACAGADPTKVKKALKGDDLLHFSTGLKSKIRVSGATSPVRVTSVRSKILGLSKFDGNSRNSRNKQGTATVSADPIGENGMGTDGNSSAPDPTVPIDETSMGSAETHIEKGLIPPIPLFPSKNDNPDSDEPWEDI